MIPVSWIIGGVVTLVTAGAVTWGVSSYNELLREEGRTELRNDADYTELRREEGRAEMRPLMAKQTAIIKEHLIAFDEISKAMAIIKARSEEIERGRAAARLLQQRREAQTEKDIAAARAFVPVGETKLERLESLIDQHLPSSNHGTGNR
jgi:hypothetical protein